MQSLTEETEALRSSLDEGKTSLEKGRQTLKQQIDDEEKVELQKDLDKIMANLTRR